MIIQEAVQFLDKSIPDKTIGLPDDIFYFISRTTPLVNVDLLVKDKRGRVLLSWRDDEYAGKGWHVPGSIIRYKETLEHAVQRCAKSELGTEVEFDSKPLAVGQLIIPKLDNRAHYIYFLYRCFVPEDYGPVNTVAKNVPGYLEWHQTYPDDMIEVHDMYRKYI